MEAEDVEITSLFGRCGSDVTINCSLSSSIIPPSCCERVEAFGANVREALEIHVYYIIKIIKKQTYDGLFGKHGGNDKQIFGRSGRRGRPTTAYAVGRPSAAFLEHPEEVADSTHRCEHSSERQVHDRSHGAVLRDSVLVRYAGLEVIQGFAAVHVVTASVSGNHYFLSDDVELGGLAGYEMLQLLERFVEGGERIADLWAELDAQREVVRGVQVQRDSTDAGYVLFDQICESIPVFVGEITVLSRDPTHAGILNLPQMGHTRFLSLGIATWSGFLCSAAVCDRSPTVQR